MPKGMGYSGDYKPGRSVSMKYGTSSMKSGGGSSGGQSGMVYAKGDSGPMPLCPGNPQVQGGNIQASPNLPGPQANMLYPTAGAMSTPKANVQHPQSGTVTTPKANVQYPHNSGGKVRY